MLRLSVLMPYFGRIQNRFIVFIFEIVVSVLQNVSMENASRDDVNVFLAGPEFHVS